MDETASPRPASRAPLPPPIVVVSGAWDWTQVAEGPSGADVAGALVRALPTRRWFGGKLREIRGLRILETLRLPHDARLLLTEIEFVAGPSEIYQLALAYAEGARGERVGGDNASFVWAVVRSADARDLGVLYDPLCEDAFRADLLGLFATEASVEGAGGRLIARRTPSFAALRRAAGERPATRLVQAEQSNSSIVYGERLIAKLFRRVERGQNPDLEVNLFLTAHGFAHVPPVAGALEYRAAAGEPWTLGMLQEFVPNRGDAWQFVLERLEELMRAPGAPLDRLPAARGGLTAAARKPIPPTVVQAMGGFTAIAERLATRTAELHRALAGETQDAAFAPEPFSAADGQEFCQRGKALLRDAFEMLRKRLDDLSSDDRAQAVRVLAREAAIDGQFARLSGEKFEVAKIRCHGDYHLGQVLVTDDDFAIIDFEGEPARPLAERRAKQLALRDVAGMIRSFHYATCYVAAAIQKTQAPAEWSGIEKRSGAWYFWTSVIFLAAYCRAASGAVFLPGSDEQFERLLAACLAEKAVYELRYELNNRPDWVYLPLEALAELAAGE